MGEGGSLRETELLGIHLFEIEGFSPVKVSTPMCCFR